MDKGIIMTDRVVWEDLYWQTWKGILHEDTYKHPAKFAPGLIRRIYTYMHRELYIPRNSVILDPFAGVGCGALYAMINGHLWIGHEIEKMCHYLGNRQICYWEERYKNAYTLGEAHLLRRDSAVGPYTYQGILSPTFCPEVVISSPPFGAGETRNRSTFQGGEITSAMSRAYTQDNQGQHNNNLARLKENHEVFDAIVSSPPFEDLVKMGKGPGTRGGTKHNSPERAHKLSSDSSFGSAEGQMGNTNGQDFWEQAKLVVDNCHQALAPGGYAIWVCKDYVRAGKRIPFSDKWEMLCKSCGFEPYQRIEASLVTDNGTQSGLFEDRKYIKERKTFFRRLAEGKGSPEINHEDIIVMRKPPG